MFLVTINTKTMTFENYEDVIKQLMIFYKRELKKHKCRGNIYCGCGEYIVTSDPEHFVHSDNIDEIVNTIINGKRKECERRIRINDEKLNIMIFGIIQCDINMSYLCGDSNFHVKTLD